MIPRPPYRYSLVCIALAFGVVLFACRTTPDPTSIPPSATPPSTKLSLPVAPTIAQITPAPTAPIDQPQYGQPTILSFTLTLPEDWQYVTLTETNSQQTLLTLATENPTLHVQVDGLLQGEEQPSALVVAWPAAQIVDSGLIAYGIPRRDLTLHRYQRAVGQILATEPTITLRETTLRYDLRDDVPIGYLHYMIPSTDRSPVLGYHYWLLNQDATELLLLTFFTNAQDLTAVADDTIFSSIVKGVHRGAPVVTTP